LRLFFYHSGIRLLERRNWRSFLFMIWFFILLISNAVQNAMVGPDSTLTGGLVAAGSLFVVITF